MRRQLAPVCRVMQRPVPGSPLGPSTHLTLMKRPGTPYTEMLLGTRAECLRAAIQVAANCAEYDAGRPQPTNEAV